MIRNLYKLIPSKYQQLIKLAYYNIKFRDYKFDFSDSSYTTKSLDGWSVNTLSPLYFIVKDLNRYEKFYSLKSGDIVIDAGANEGLLSVIFGKKVGALGRVIAIEPDSQNCIRFKNNISLNDAMEQVSLTTMGLWKSSGNLKFFEAGTVGSSIFYKLPKSKEKKISVTSLDDLVVSKSLEKLNLIKMDIEGAEIEALIGATNTIREFNPNFSIASYHMIEGKPTYLKVEAIFKTLNYPYKTIFFEDGEIMTYAGPSVEGV
jgi:FkbM family methyltransferase